MQLSERSQFAELYSSANNGWAKRSLSKRMSSFALLAFSGVFDVTDNDDDGDVSAD